MTMINYLLGARCHMDVNVSVSVSVSLSLSDSRQLSLYWCFLCTFHLCTLQGNCSWSGGKGATSSWTWKSLMKLLFCITNAFRVSQVKVMRNCWETFEKWERISRWGFVDRSRHIIWQLLRGLLWGDNEENERYLWYVVGSIAFQMFI